ncbi:MULTISPECIES: Asp23/Gls24 family envelope stress response protein [unclassified Pseudoclavibacter]|uniref:Asp23/Gls24 family envelope stress response protein n=1 Tax=unclassified Pseudoclavibacter TaxID=2615177 RepID=UPI0012EF577D|nr:MULTISPECIES: Asp23/Gls24 family envelope stress response protein [unclassified Pseudoclavibacter]MBF4459878.1 Asp23/Gls24 family envelope stress response protein [Pseudoclavibacter sp. VKM Ac-2867]VXC21271.1 Asp23/Gls24 family envelope stress response protein [Pseudoclavibacter sp. 8L]
MTNVTPNASATPSTVATPKTDAASKSVVTSGHAGTELASTHGTTTVVDSVVARVAGIAAREARGVYDLGGGAARAIGAIRNALNASDQSQGVSVEVGEKQVAVDITIVAEYPVSLQDVADGVRADVIRAVESIVGLEVTEVNVTINDVHLPSDDNQEEPAEARVQ